jgi:hypothetical protein
MIDEPSQQRIIESFLLELKKVVKNTPQYGEIGIQVKIFDYKVGTVTTKIKTARKTSEI